MARSRRASSVATTTNTTHAGSMTTSNIMQLPQHSSTATRPNLIKKSSRLAVFLKHLKSPSNSDGEDGDNDDGHSDSDLDFGCTGLKAFDELDELLHEDNNGDLHISLPATTTPSGDGTKHLLPVVNARSDSITDSLTSSISSITLDSSRSRSHSSISISDPSGSCYSQPESARSSISHPSTHLHLSHSPTKKTFFIHGSCTPSPRISIGTSTAIQPKIIQEESEEDEDEEQETEEEGVLRRKQEEQAAIEALEAYFAYRKASDSMSSRRPPSNSSDKHVRPQLSPCSHTTSNSINGDDKTLSTARQSAGRKSDDSGVALSSNDLSIEMDTLKATTPHSSPYFEKYANEPLYSITSASRGQQQDTSSRPPLRSRRSEASLKTASAASIANANVASGTLGQKRRPSLASALMPIQVRPRGYTYSTSPSSSSNSTLLSPTASPSVPSPSSSDKDQVIHVPVLLNSPSSAASTSNSFSPSIYAVSIPSSPSTPAAAHPPNSSTSTQIVNYTRGTPTSSSFLNFGDSPQGPHFSYDSSTKKKGSALREYKVIPSPPRSSSLAHAQSGIMQEAQARALALNNSPTSPISPTSLCHPSPTSPAFTKETYNETLQGYRFPDGISRERSKSASSSASARVSASHPGSYIKASATYAMNKEEKEDKVTMAPRVHSPLGQATASRRGSLVSGCLPTQNRNRAGSIAAVGNGTNNSSSRKPIYEYI